MAEQKITVTINPRQIAELKAFTIEQIREQAGERGRTPLDNAKHEKLSELADEMDDQGGVSAFYAGRIRQILELGA
jgi:hypothetical protein